MATKKTNGIVIDIGGNTQPLQKALKEVNNHARSLQYELKQVDKLLDIDPSNTELLAQKQAILAESIENTSEKLKRLKEAQEQVQNQFNKGDITAEQYRAFTRQIVQAESQLNNLEGELNDCNTALSRASLGISDTAKSMGELEDKTAETGNIFKETFASGIVLESVKAVAESIKNIGEEIVKTTAESANFAKEIETISQKMGMSNQKYQEWDYVLKTVGSSAEQAQGDLSQLAEKALDAANGSGEAAELFAKLNLNVRDSNGALKSQSVLFDEVIYSLRAMSDETERNAIASALMSTTGENLVPILNMTSTELNALKNSASEMGYILEDNAITALSDTDTAIAKMNMSITAAKNNFSAEIAPEISKAAEKISSKVGILSDKMADMAQNVIPIVVDGFSWLIDNSNVITNGLKGIAAAMITYKATGAIESAAKSWLAYKTAVEGATVKQWAFNAAQGASPLGVATIAIGAAVTATGLYIDQLIKAAREQHSVIAESEEIANAANSLNESISNNIKSRAEMSNNIEAENNSSIKLIDTIFQLSEKENISNQEKAQMLTLIEELNRNIPNLNLVYDEHTQTLNRQRESVEKLLQNNIELQKVKVAEGDLTNIAKEQYDAEKQLVELEAKRLEIQQELDGLEMWRMGKSIADYYAESGELNKALDENSKSISDTKKNIQDLGAEYNNTLKYIGENKGIAQAGEIISNLGETIETTSEKIKTANENSKKAIDELTASYEKAVEDRTNQIANATNIFAEFAVNTETSGAQLLENLKGQVEGITQWRDNLQELSSRGLSSGLVSELQGMGTSAAGEIYALTTLTDEQLVEYNRVWEEKTALAHNIAVAEFSSMKDDIIAESEKLKSENDSIAQAMVDEMGGVFVNGKKVTGEKALELLKTIYDNAVPYSEQYGYELGNGIVVNFGKALTDKQEQIQKYVNEIMLGGTPYSREMAYEMGKNMADGTQEGFDDNFKTNAFTNKFDILQEKINEDLEIHSPSKVFARIGGFMAEGINVGWSDKIKNLSSKISASLKPNELNQQAGAISKAMSNSQTYNSSNVNIKMGDINVTGNASGINIDEIKRIASEQAQEIQRITLNSYQRAAFIN